MKSAFTALAILLAEPVIALAEDAPHLCVAASGPHGKIAEKDGTWTELTPDQWQFARGIYAMNPMTPPGLPFGDKAVLATIPGENSALIFFIDGDLACTPMPAPEELVDMLHKIGSGEIPHEGDHT